MKCGLFRLKERIKEDNLKIDKTRSNVWVTEPHARVVDILVVNGSFLDKYTKCNYNLLNIPSTVWHVQLTTQRDDFPSSCLVLLSDCIKASRSLSTAG